VLGEPRAPIAIIEYTGFDCAACTQAHGSVVPRVIDRYVRTGEVSIELRLLAAGDHDLALALAVSAARPQNRAWQMVQLQYLRSGSDPNAPLAALETPSAQARALGLDVPKWKRDIDERQWAVDMQAALAVFKVAKWGATPIFLIRRRGSDLPFEVLSAPTAVEAFDQAIAAARDR
jgi:protein-disulfide isomerase